MDENNKDNEYERERVELARRLRGYRKKIDMSGVELAEKTGMSQSKVSRLESGVIKPSHRDMEALTKALRIPKEERDQLMLQAEIVSRWSGTGVLCNNRSHKKMIEAGNALADTAQKLVAESLKTRSQLTHAEVILFKAVFAWQEASGE